MTRMYLVILEKGEEAWGAFSPDVPGTGGMGDTADEARSSLREGIGYMLDYCVEQSQPFPESSNIVDFGEFDTNLADSHYEIEWMTVELPEISIHAEQHVAQAA